MTRLIVKHYHELSSHSAGTNFVLSQINGRVRIVAVYEEISACKNELSECKRCRNKPVTQMIIWAITTSKAALHISCI